MRDNEALKAHLEVLALCVGEVPSEIDREEGDKAIAALREELFPTPPIRAKAGDIIEITNPGSDDDPAVKGCRFTVLHVMDGSGFVTTKERFLGFYLGEFEVVG